MFDILKIAVVNGAIDCILEFEKECMWGADDPFGRKPLWWSELKFQPENRNNVQNLKPIYDKVGFNEATYLFYKKLIKIRKENPVLIDGELNFLETTGKKMVYERTLNGSKIIVLFNAGNECRKFHFESGRYIELLTNKIINDKTLKLNALQSAILKKT